MKGERDAGLGPPIYIYNFTYIMRLVALLTPERVSRRIYLFLEHSQQDTGRNNPKYQRNEQSPLQIRENTAVSTHIRVFV